MDSHDDETIREAELLARRAKLLSGPVDEGLMRLALLEDFETLREMDQAARGEDPDVRSWYLKACERHGRKGRQFNGYLEILLRRARITLTEAAEKFGIKESTLVDWLMGFKAPDYEMVARISDILSLSEVQANRLLDGRQRLDFQEELEKVGPENYQMSPEESEGLNNWVRRFQKREKTFGAQLELQRALHGCRSAEEMSEVAYVSAENWQAWEEDRALPSYREVEALVHLICQSKRVREMVMESWRKAKRDVA